MKIARGRELLTLEQRQDFMQIPEDEWILGTYFTFSKRDLEIVNKRRREENRLGFAVQLAVLRCPGWPYTHIKSIPESVIHYISKQIGATPSSISLYPQRENTLWDHLKELRSEYDFVTFTLREYRIAFKHLHQLAFENGDAIHLLHECIDFLRKNKIILPTIMCRYICGGLSHTVELCNFTKGKMVLLNHGFADFLINIRLHLKYI